MTGNVTAIIRHTYKVLKALKTYTVYQFQQSVHLSKNGHTPTRPILTPEIRIEQFRHFSKGTGFDDYLRLKTKSNWQKCEKVTGLFKTDNKRLFYGDRLNNGKKHLLVFIYSLDQQTLVIDYFVGYCPQKCDLNAILNRYTQTINKQ